MIEVKNIYCGYDNKKIIKDLSFNVNNGENLCIVGPNGCGKSTLLKSIANIIEYEGSIKIDNKEVSSFSRIDLAKKVALMSQTSQIYFPYTVYELKDKLITELSGGQLQRVFLAKIFAQDPDIILLDEPTNHLDFKNQIDLLENLNEWVKTNNKIVIGVLHDLNLVQYFADKVLMIQSGKVVSYGRPEDVLKGEILNDIYGMDIKEFMVNILQKWA